MHSFMMALFVLLSPGAVGNVISIDVDGTVREALVHAPPAAAAEPAPLMLVFHGHGGTMENMARHGFHDTWPEAIVVYPQGLPTATGRDPEGARSGWQPGPGKNGDRDLRFIDALLEKIREEHAVDDTRIFATGHSNGGGFTYLLAAARPGRLAAIAPSSCGAGRIRGSGVQPRPLPVMHLAGKTDAIVPFENQVRTMAAVRRLNNCSENGAPWKTAEPLTGTRFPSDSGTPFVSVVHPGGHKFPKEAPRIIIQFFREIEAHIGE